MSSSFVGKPKSGMSLGVRNNFGGESNVKTGDEVMQIKKDYYNTVSSKIEDHELV